MRTKGEGSLFKRADGLWVGRVTMPSGQIKQVTARRKAEALEKWQKLRETVRAGMPAPSPRLKLAEYLEEWLETYIKPRRSMNTYRVHASAVRNHLIPSMGNVPLMQLHQNHVQRFLANRSETLSTATVARLRNTLSGALARAVALDLVGRNVATLVDVPARRRKREVAPLSAEEIGRLLRVISGQPVEPIILLAVTTGMRIGEISGLTWSDIDLESGRIDLRFQTQFDKGKGMVLTELKTDKSRRSVDVPERVLGILREHRREQVELRLRTSGWEGDFVFCREVAQHGGRSSTVMKSIWAPLPHITIRGWFKRALKEAGLPSVRFHDLRHTAVSLLLAEGVPLHEVSKIVGHSSIQVTSDIYGHLVPERRKIAADIIGGVLDRVS